MIIEVKNINRSPRIPGAFMAFLYIDGEKAGLVWNRGKGLPTAYHHLDERGRTLISIAELEHKLSLPEKSIDARQRPQPLTVLIDKLVNNSGKKTDKSRRPRP